MQFITPLVFRQRVLVFSSYAVLISLFGRTYVEKQEAKHKTLLFALLESAADAFCKEQVAGSAIHPSNIYK